ncbi:MAG: amidase [Alcanivoracaceae bacterium]|nr:amidase [Alcanivoracaceae bacterium]
MTDKRIHAFCDDALGDDDAVGLARRIAAGEVSIGEVAEAAIQRANQVDPVLRGIELATFEQALQAAKKPRSGVFAGVPTFVKDNTDLAGLPTNHGSAAVNAHPAKKHGRFARQYLSLGFSVLGKSTLPEFGFNATTEFEGRAPTCNPWNPAHSSGASSGGSAALVAAGVVPVAHANDGGGSIRIPAACCGLVGLKPTRGRLVDGEAARSLPINIIGEGIVSRSVRDQAHFFYGAEQYQPARSLPEVGLVEGPGTRRLRIGLVLDSITGEATCDETRAVVLEVARELEKLGHTVEEMPLPVSPRFADDFAIYWGMLAFLMGKFGKQVVSPDFDASRLDGLSRGLAALYRDNLWKTPAVLWRLRRTRDEYARQFPRYDAVLSPVLAHTTPELGYISPAVPFDELFERLRKYVSFTPLNNTAGSPAISLPMGAAANDLPIGVQLAGAHGGERTLLELAYELEAARPFRRIQAS